MPANGNGGHEKGMKVAKSKAVLSSLSSDDNHDGDDDHDGDDNHDEHDNATTD